LYTVALGGSTRENYGEVAFGGAVHGVAIGGSYFDTDGGGSIVQEWSCGVGKAECATGVGGHVALGVGVGEGMVRIGGKVGERLGEATGGGLGLNVMRSYPARARGEQEEF
jgi:hypothetical protein